MPHLMRCTYVLWLRPPWQILQPLLVPGTCTSRTDVSTPVPLHRNAYNATGCATVCFGHWPCQLHQNSRRAAPLIALPAARTSRARAMGEPRPCAAPEDTAARTASSTASSRATPASARSGASALLRLRSKVPSQVMRPASVMDRDTPVSLPSALACAATPSWYACPQRHISVRDF